MGVDAASPSPRNRGPGGWLALIPVGLALGGAASFSSFVQISRNGEYSLWILGGFVAWTILITFFLVRFRVDRDPPDSVSTSRVLPWFALAAFTLFCLSASREIAYFPSAMDGESADATRIAELFLQSLRDGRLGEWLAIFSRRYNTGLAPLMVPVVWWFGPSSLPAKWTNVVVWAALVSAALTMLAWHVRPRVRSRLMPWILLSVVCVGSLLASVRQYRWHLMALLAALGICLIAASLNKGGRRGALIWGLGFFGLGLGLYHGNLILLPAVVALGLFHLSWPEDGERRPRRVMTILVSCLVAMLVFSYFVRDGYSGFRVRAQDEVEAIFQPASAVQRAHLVDRILRLGTDSMTWPVVALLLLGIASAMSRARRDAVMRAMLIVFGSGLAVNVLIQGVGNPSQNCWFLFPALMFAGLGILEISDRVHGAIGSRTIANAILLGGSLGLALPEWNAYQALGLYNSLDSRPYAVGTAEQFALIARQIGGPSNDIAGKILHVFPGPDVADSRGGFRHQSPLTYYEENPRAAAVLFFDSDEDLNRIIDNFASGRSRATHLVIWLSFNPNRPESTPDMLQPVLARRPFHQKLVTLIESPYPEPIRSWRLDLVRGP